MRIDVPDPGAARSFWLQEALRDDPGEPCPPLDAHVVADVCVVGGGFAGLWTAVRLTEREPSLRIALLEQDVVGGGASGRNGGFFSSSWWDLRALIGLYGLDEGVRYALALADAVEEAETFCRDNDIDRSFQREGTLGVLAGAWQEGIGRDEAIDLCARLGLADRMVAVSADEARRTRTRRCSSVERSSAIARSSSRPGSPAASAGWRWIAACGSTSVRG